MALQIGNTPLVEVGGIFAKLECVNPTGSIKDRIAEYLIVESIRQGKLRPGMRIVEATSGNTGIAFAYYGKQHGYGVTIVMPEHMSEERKRILRKLGAELVLCSAAGSFAEAATIRDAMAQANSSYFNPDQFSNPLNVECHHRTTGQEILRQMEGRTIDAFVAGVGTGGTLIGVGQALRERYPAAWLVAVEPTESAVMSGGRTGPHEIQGIGDGFIPTLAGNGNGGVHPMITRLVQVSSEEAKGAAGDLCRQGWCVGISSGANYVAARQVAAEGKTVVTVFPDGYMKYRSLGLDAHVPCAAGQCSPVLATLGR